MELDVGQPILLVPGEGEVVGDSEDRRVEILCDRDELVVTWTRFGPGRDGAIAAHPPHHTDLFFVLAGELTFVLGAEHEERVPAPAGTLAFAPPFVVHGFRNASRRGAALPQLPCAGRRLRRLPARRDPGFDSEEPPADGGRPVRRRSSPPGPAASSSSGTRSGSKCGTNRGLHRIGSRASTPSKTGACSRSRHNPNLREAVVRCSLVCACWRCSWPRSHW